MQRTTTALLAAGDADSLAAAALLGHWPGAPAERLALLSRAIAAAPERGDLIWLNISACTLVESCDPMPLAVQLQRVDPANGAAWFASTGRAGKLSDEAAVRRSLAAIATSASFGIYWNATIVRATNAVLRTKKMNTAGKIDLPHFWNARYAARRLQLMTENQTEQEVNLAEIMSAKLNPNPPSNWTDSGGGS